VRIEVLPEAQFDLVSGFRFYERQARGLGQYFLDSLFSDIELLADHGEFTRAFSAIIAA
jgi:hypothetical protein